MGSLNMPLDDMYLYGITILLQGQALPLFCSLIS